VHALLEFKEGADNEENMIEQRMQEWSEAGFSAGFVKDSGLHNMTMGAIADIVFLAESDSMILSASQFSEIAVSATDRCPSPLCQHFSLSLLSMLWATLQVVTSLGLHGYTVPLVIIWDFDQPFQATSPCNVLEGGVGHMGAAHCLIGPGGEVSSRKLHMGGIDEADGVSESENSWTLANFPVKPWAREDNEEEATKEEEEEGGGGGEEEEAAAEHVEGEGEENGGGSVETRALKAVLAKLAIHYFARGQVSF
jgi:hypothetical protein